MRSIGLLLLLVSGTPAAAVGELGVRLEVVSSVWIDTPHDRGPRVSIPGSGSVYAVVFPIKEIALGPNFSYFSEGYGKRVYLGVLLGYYPRGHQKSGIYTEVELGSWDDETLTKGIGLGFRGTNPAVVWRTSVYYKWREGYKGTYLIFALGAIHQRGESPQGARASGIPTPAAVAGGL